MEKKVMKLAPNGRRFAAYIIDSVIPFIFGCVILTTIIGYNSMRNAMDPFSMYGFGSEFFDLQPSISLGSIMGIGFMSLLYFAYLVVEIYFYTKSKTIGKAIMGIQVVSSKNGDPVGVWWMLLREWIVKDASKAILCLGYIWILIDEKHRGWHDKICDTYVVDIRVNNSVNESKNYGEINQF